MCKINVIFISQLRSRECIAFLSLFTRRFIGKELGKCIVALEKEQVTFIKVSIALTWMRHSFIQTQTESDSGNKLATYTHATIRVFSQEALKKDICHSASRESLIA